MSEYWKSTPKYWCKFCKTYVRDTKFEKQQHEATPRHQGNIQRSLRTLHREHEREDREKQRAKDEVARLNGLVSGNPVAKSSPSNRSTTAPSGPPPQSNPEERKRQMKQLADMGVAIPKEYRGDLALAGDWETVAERPLEKESKAESLSHGVHKRKLEEDEEFEAEEAIGKPVKRNAWGSTFRQYPGDDQSGADDIEALLRSGSTAGERRISNNAVTDEPFVKEENDDVETKPVVGMSAEEVTKKEETPPAIAPVIFKKRKAKVMKT